MLDTLHDHTWQDGVWARHSPESVGCTSPTQDSTQDYKMNENIIIVFATIT